MKLNLVLTINALLALGFGIAFALYGPVMLAYFSVPEIPSDDILLYWNVAAFARMFGATLFGFGLLLWAIRGVVDHKNTSPEVRRGIVFALLLANIMGAFIAITQQFSIWESPAGWVSIAIFLLLLLAYGYLLAVGPERKLEQTPE
jgi:Ca2+/Na+ antiporter